jgi:hypothetical protein
MIPLEKQVCSRQLSERLRELGVKQESYFKWVGDEIWDPTQQSDYETQSTLPRNKWIAAFTVAELGEILKDHTALSTEWSKVHKQWYLGYDPANTFSETEADARAKILIYLVENKLVTL